jgi:hypothetical protein
LLVFLQLHIYHIIWSILFILFDFYITVPGDGGSQVEAKLHKEEVVHYLCEKTTQDFFNIWLNMELLVPLVIDCWLSKQPRS